MSGLMGGGSEEQKPSSDASAKSGTAGVAAGAAAKPTSEDYKPPKSEVVVDLVDADHLKLAPALVVPTVYVRLPVSGKVSVTEQGSALAEMRTGGSANTVKASAEFTVKGLDKALAQKIAAAINDDLIAQLKAAGINAKGYADVKDTEVFKDADRKKPDAKWGMPTETLPGGMTVVLAAPSDEQVFDTGMVAGVFNQFFSLGKTKVKDGVLIIPELTVTAPQMWGQKSESYSTISAAIGSAPAMELIRADASWLAPNPPVRMMRGIPGAHLKGHTSLSTRIGELVMAEDTTSGTANAVSGVLGFLTGTGSIKSSSARFELTIDKDAYFNAVVEGGKKFNAELVKAAVANRP